MLLIGQVSRVFSAFVAQVGEHHMRLVNDSSRVGEQAVVGADIGGRRGIRNGATTSSFLDPETRQLLRTQPAGRAGPAGGVR